VFHGLTKLRVLKVSSCNALEELAGIEHLMSSRCLKLQCGGLILEHLCQPTYLFGGALAQVGVMGMSHFWPRMEC
jgi:hypothetical protein